MEVDLEEEDKDVVQGDLTTEIKVDEEDEGSIDAEIPQGKRISTQGEASVDRRLSTRFSQQLEVVTLNGSKAARVSVQLEPVSTGEKKPSSTSPRFSQTSDVRLYQGSGRFSVQLEQTDMQRPTSTTGSRKGSKTSTLLMQTSRKSIDRSQRSLRMSSDQGRSRLSVQEQVRRSSMRSNEWNRKASRGSIHFSDEAGSVATQEPPPPPQTTAQPPEDDDKQKAKVIQQLILEEEDEESVESGLCGRELHQRDPHFICMGEYPAFSESLLSFVRLFPDIEDPGLEEAFNAIVPDPVYDDIGVERYRNICKELDIVPIGRVINALDKRVLDLKYVGLSTKAMRAIAETLIHNLHVEELLLQDNHLEPEAAKYLGDLLRENHKLKNVNLRECRLGADGIDQLIEGLTSTQTLEEIDLSFNSLGDEGMTKLGPALQENSSIKKINLGHNCMTERSAPYLASLLRANVDIRELSLSWNYLFHPIGIKMMCDGLAANKGIKTLDLSWNAISAPEACLPIMKCLMANDCLENLSLNYNRITGQGSRMVRKGMLSSKSLKFLNIGNNPLSAEDASYFAKALLEPTEGSLVGVDMENIWLPKGSSGLLKRIEDSGKKLRVGGIYGNFPIKGPVEKEVLLKRARYLGFSPKKKKAKKDFGTFLQSVEDAAVPLDVFHKKMTKYKLKTIDDDLVRSLATTFTAGGNNIKVSEMTDQYLKMYPDTPLPKEKKKKKKKKRKKKGRKGKKAAKETKAKAGRPRGAKQKAGSAAPAKEAVAAPAAAAAEETMKTEESQQQGEEVQHPEENVSEENAKENTGEAAEEVAKEVAKEAAKEVAEEVAEEAAEDDAEVAEDKAMPYDATPDWVQTIQANQEPFPEEEEAEYDEEGADNQP